MGGFSTLGKRTAVSLIYAPLMLWVFWSGGTVLKIIMALAAFLSFYEAAKTAQAERIFHIIFLPAAGIIFIHSPVLAATLMLVFLLFLPFLLYSFGKHDPSRLSSWALLLLICTYVAAGSYSVIYLRTTFGVKHSLFVLCSIWVFDNFAYFSGVLFGRRRIFPVLSPKKSIEGIVGGLIFNLILGGLAGRLIFGRIYLYALLSVLVGVLAQIGDLYESLFKRHYNIKDFSDILPGHGGIMDRFDSIFYTFPVMCIVLKLLGLKG